MYLVRPLQRGDRRLAQADMADLAFADQIRHRADDVLDRYLRIDPVLIIKIDLLHAQRRRLPSTERRIYSGRLLTPRAEGSAGSRRMPNLVAGTPVAACP